jgi:hypothetical protein
VPRRRGVAAAAAAAAEAVREPSATPSEPSTVKRKNVVIIRFKDKQDHEKRVKVKKSNTLEKAMNAFRQEAEAQVSVFIDCFCILEGCGLHLTSKIVFLCRDGWRRAAVLDVGSFSRETRCGQMLPLGTWIWRMTRLSRSITPEKRGICRNDGPPPRPLVFRQYQRPAAPIAAFPYFCKSQ